MAAATWWNSIIECTLIVLSLLHSDILTDIDKVISKVIAKHLKNLEENENIIPSKPHLKKTQSKRKSTTSRQAAAPPAGQWKIVPALY
jgi:hypothetical protein